VNFLNKDIMCVKAIFYFFGGIILEKKTFTFFRRFFPISVKKNCIFKKISCVKA